MTTTEEGRAGVSPFGLDAAFVRDLAVKLKLSDGTMIDQ